MDTQPTQVDTMNTKPVELEPKNGSTNGDQEDSSENDKSTNITEVTSVEEDPEDWIRENIVRKNFIMKASYMSRLGMKVSESLSKENVEKMNHAYEEERKIIEQEQQSIDSEEFTVEKSYSNEDFSINFLKKTDDEVRNSFINKLFNMKMLKTEPAKKHQSMIIFDWDDTLLCTTFLGSLGFLDIPQEILATIKPLDESAAKLLIRSVNYGETFIITNSAEGWVQYSSRLFMPKTHDVILEKKIKVISARSGYESIFPGDCHRWKMEAFLDMKKNFDKNIITNLICLGDSHIEIDAAHVLAGQFNQAMIKTVKYRENPRPDELVKQLELVYDKFEQIYYSIRNLTIRLERRSSNS